MIRSVAVLGAGVMGAQIAAHFANADVPVLLLDVTGEAAAAGLKRARSSKPDPFFAADTSTLITTASFDDGLARLQEADWIVEAVVEQIAIKRDLLARVDAVRRPGSIVSSNTSAIPIADLAEGRSDDFRQHWLGTHFFNPPRYLHLLEVIPTGETLPMVVERVRAFADHRLGKGVVVVKDSPGFIGNHLALYGMARIIEQVARGAYSIEEADAITGPILGRPKSATFRTLDLAGMDVLSHVMRDLSERLGGRARQDFRLPDFAERMIAAGLIGEKAGKGFYTRTKNASGETEISVIDPESMTYRPQQPPRLPSIDKARTIADLRERSRTLFSGGDRVGQFLRETLAPMLVYAARIAPEVAHAPVDIDRVMRWGFGWELGPFELIDAIGVDRVLAAAKESAPELLAAGVPPLLDRQTTSVSTATAIAPRTPTILGGAHARQAVVSSNAGASLVDIGESVLCVEFHSKMNALGADAIQMLERGVREAERNFAALVVGNDAVNFSAGANLMLILLEARNESWDEIDLMIRSFQDVNQTLRYAGVPVVVAAAGLTLGGGCEVALHADRIQAAAETYIGLVEAGVGLIPAGGGTKEMTARAADATAPRDTLVPAIRRAFETIAFAKTSTSATHARELGYLRDLDAVTMNRDRLIEDARRIALQRVAEGYHPPQPRTAVRVGGDTVLAPLKLGIHLAQRAARISDHDALIARKLAVIMAGGEWPHATAVSEQHLLDLEREAFLSLIGESKTQDRIQHTLQTGKVLRN